MASYFGDSHIRNQQVKRKDKQTKKTSNLEIKANAHATQQASKHENCTVQQTYR